MGENIKILLIEDNPGDSFLVEEYLNELVNFSYKLKIVETLTEALIIIKKQFFDIILLDLELPDSNGVNTFVSVQNINPLIPIIILTGLNNKVVESYVLKKGAYDFLVKGQTEDRLLECIRQCFIEHKKKQYSVMDEHFLDF